MKMKITKKVILMVLSVMTMLGLCACGKTKVDLKEYVSVEVSGMDGYGRVEVTVDYTELGLALGVDEKIGEWKDADNISDVAEALIGGDAIYKLKCSADKSEGLKNGDEITITAKNYESVEEKLDASFSNTEFTYTVSGLEPIQEIDPFEGVTISYGGGLDSFGGYSIRVESPEQYDGLIAYEAEKPETMKVGGTVTVTCQYDEETLANKGYAVRSDAPTSKDFTIEGIDAYIDSFASISDETLEEMKKKCVSLIKSTYFGVNGSYNDIQSKLEERKNIDYNWEEPNGKLKSQVKYEGGYFKMENRGNLAAMMFSFKVKDRKTSATMYAVVQFKDVIQKASGDIYVDYESGGWSNYVISYLDTNVKDIENELVTNNEFEKVN